MKIYALMIDGKTEWVAANTIIEALQKYITITGIELSEFDNDDDIKEISIEKWSELKVMSYKGEFETEQSFAEVMNHLQVPGIITVPCYDYPAL